MNRLDEVIAYHAASRHEAGRFARSPGHLDWPNHPEPFRNYEGARRYRFAFPEDDDSPPLHEVIRAGLTPACPMTAERVGQLFQYGVGLSAWRSLGGERWSLRIPPSAGNLHPTESYLITGPTQGMSAKAGVFHYAPEDHALELRAVLTEETWAHMAGPCADRFCFVGFSCIPWRMAWKYGERAYRYCQLDAGHAIAAVAMSAAALGWRVRLCEGLGDEDVAGWIGLGGLPGEDRLTGPEPEWPVCLLAISGETSSPEDGGIGWPAPIAPPSGSIRWHGIPSQLSRERRAWMAIDRVAEACWKEAGEPGMARSFHQELSRSEDVQMFEHAAYPRSYWKVAGSRRSALTMDPGHSIGRSVFYRVLRRLVASAHVSPWEVFGGRHGVCVAVLAHRIEGLPSGVYVLARHLEGEEALMEQMGVSRWEGVEGSPPDIKLRLVRLGDQRNEAERVFCGQTLASDGVFCMVALARVADTIKAHGTWHYRRLHWEAGMAGHVLSLAAVEAGLQATGLGCFLDEALLRLCGIRQEGWAALYGMSVGMPIDDTRLALYAPYPPERMEVAGWVEPA